MCFMSQRLVLLVASILPYTVPVDVGCQVYFCILEMHAHAMHF